MRAKRIKPTEPREKRKLDFNQMLTDALTLEGQLSDCYRMFHNYSFNNQVLAMLQLPQPEPINTFMGWQALGRNVKKGQHAIELCMPFNIRTNKDDEGADPEYVTGFGFRRNWFGLSQTEGKPYELPETIGFDKARVLNALGITEIAFEHTNGNAQGFSRDLSLAINPVAKYPLKTLWHELGHIVCGHTQETTFADDERIPRSLREVEAESVAYLLCNVFGYDEPKVAARGYIQNWIDTETIPAESAKRIFKAVNDILKANLKANTPAKAEVTHV